MSRFEVTRSLINKVTSEIKNPYLLKNIFISIYNKSHEDELEQQLNMYKAMGKEVVFIGYGEEIALPDRSELLQIINTYENTPNEMRHDGYRKNTTLSKGNVVLTDYHYYITENDALFWYVKVINVNIDDIQSVKIDYDALTDALYEVCVDSNAFTLARRSGKCKLLADMFEYIEKETVAVTVMLDGKVIDKKDVKLMRTGRKVTWNDLKK